MDQEIIINGVKYVSAEQKDSEIKIVVLQRGWVAVGKWERKENDCKLTDASVIRVWGTTKGLGELIDGPTSKTILDKTGVIQFDFLTVVCMFDCESEKWKNEL